MGSGQFASLGMPVRIGCGAVVVASLVYGMLEPFTPIESAFAASLTVLVIGGSIAAFAFYRSAKGMDLSAFGGKAPASAMLALAVWVGGLGALAVNEIGFALIDRLDDVSAVEAPVGQSDSETQVDPWSA